MATDLAQLGLSVDSRQVRTATRDLDRMPASARRAEQSTQRLTASTRQMSQGFGQLQSTISRFLPVLGGALTAAGLTRAVQNAVNAFSELERQQLTVQQVIRSTGMSAGRTAEQIEDLATSIASATLTSREEVRQAATQLLTFRTVATESFDRTLRAAQDLAAVGFGSITSNATALGRALEDPTQGLTLLRRAGISFTQQQRDLINSLMESGQELEAQRVILGQIEAQVGGAGAAAGGGLAGAYDALSQEVDIFIERTGQQIAELTGLESIMRRISGLLAADNQAAAFSRSPRGRMIEFQNAVQPEIDRLRALVEEDDRRIAAVREQVPEIRNTPVSELTMLGDARNQLAALESEAEARRMLANNERFSREMQERLALRRSEQEAAQRQADQLQGVISRIDEETEALALTNVERRVQQEIRRAGVKEDSEEAAVIREKVELYFQEQERLREVADNRRGAAGASREQADAAAEVIRRLEEEIQMHGMSEQARRTYQELQRAGVDLYSEEGQRISDLVEELHRLEGAQGALGGSAQQLGSTLQSSFSGFFNQLVTGTQNAEQSVASLLNSLSSLLMNRAFEMLFSGGFQGGSFIGAMFGRAAGGPVMAGQPYTVGERGRETFVPNQSGTIVPNHMAAQANDNGGMAVHVTIGWSKTADGNLKPFVEDVATQRAGSVVSAAAPRIVQQSTQASGSALSRGDYDRGMARYGVSRSARVR